MMGTSHAISGAAAWVAVTATAVPALGIHPMTPSTVVLGSLVAAGAALLPDADHHNATIAHSLPVAGRVVAGTVGRLTGGHRHGMHSLLAVVGIALGTYALSFVHWTPPGWDHALQVGSAAAVLACTTFATKVLRLAKSWRLAWLIGALMAAAVLLWAPAEFDWLPLCIGLGFLVHLIGDALTIEGVPFLWPLRPKAPRLIQATPIIRHVWKPNGFFAVPILGHAGSWREWLLTLPLAGYALWGVGASVASLVGG
ncbi:metal-dependent hydrolase [Microbacterium sp. ASV81]|uniref:Metal-dependent hydrolase n=1 Tax=Microbacterium capsulatum TaxID=3041921 RepID=A0ABU0XD62_9MICO|nr:metal-dependent hydrolase [Microbacterium sp. ASV81]MDQ4212659.1 metal-dependent hydrolase [Microbacterium sp. ASV81]